MRTLKLMLIALATCAAQAAIAHTELTESAPANHAMLEAAPENVTLHFSEAVRLTALAVQKDGEGKRSLGPLPSDPSEHFVVAAPMLNDGHYTVSWRALSEDTHVMTGDIMFMVGEHGEHGKAMPHAADGNGEHPDHGTAADTPDHADHSATR